ncbi:MAG: hypothetical protein J5721_06180 [Lachnospiraceae bacterium]|nr:hypothetical protein [Lachnospiraceae bacterium]
MLYVLGIILCLSILFGGIKLALKLTWKLTKFVLVLVFLPLIIAAVLLGGLFMLAIPVLIIVGLVAVVASLSKELVA